MKEILKSITPDLGLGYVAVFDLDGTLSDDRWREEVALAARKAVGNEERDSLWGHYHDLAKEDNPNQEIKDFYTMCFKLRLEVWIVTARPEKFAEATKSWIAHNLGWSPDRLVMRPEGNRERAQTLKDRYLREQVGSGCLGYYFIIDNSAGVIDKVKDLGPTLLFNAGPILPILPNA